MRVLILVHRWLGVSFCLLFAMWFTTGIVMHFVPFPTLTEAERVAGLAPFDLPRVAHGPADAVRASGITNASRVRLFARTDGLVYLVSDLARVQMATSQIVPLPPLAEQHRIVAKVDELMGLCDRLEAARQAREAVRDKLTAASLARLNAPDPETFQADARFAFDALPALTARADQIKALRQTILNLAVCGKLVPQDAKDEPAPELLKRIAAENKKLMAAKGIRSQKPALPAENFEADTEIPPTWRHVYLQDIAYQITDGTHLTPKYTEAGKPFLEFYPENEGGPANAITVDLRTPHGTNLKDLPRRYATIVEKNLLHGGLLQDATA